MAISEGDVVRLKSGGPPMTADKRVSDGWNCKWFVETKDGIDLKFGVFQENSLEVAKNS